MENKIRHLQDENVRLKNENSGLKAILADVIESYGDRATHLDKLFTREYQPAIIQRAMDAVGYGCTMGKAVMECPICGEALKIKIHPPGDVHRWHCPTCEYSKPYK